jgi:glycosyltransferase involved in cell wall biosynthesis
VLSLRNYRENTNLDIVLRAFARAHAEEPRARLILAAREGVMTETVRGWVSDLGVGDAVRMHFIPPAELPFFCASSDLAVSLASTDATPASMLECMASRLPLVMGDAITIDEWITQGEGGEVVQCRDEDAVTEALLRLLRDPQLAAAYGERNLRVVRERLPEAEPAFCAACAAATGGNPFLLRELLARVQHDGMEPVAGEAPAVARLAPDAVLESVLATVPAPR